MDISVNKGFVKRAEVVFDEVINHQVENPDEKGGEAPANQKERNVFSIRVFVVHHCQGINQLGRVRMACKGIFVVLPCFLSSNSILKFAYCIQLI